MKNKTILIILALVLVIGGAALLYNMLGGSASDGQLQTMAPGEKRAEDTSAPTASSATSAASESQTRDPNLQQAPDFTVYDENGRSYKLSDFRGKPVVLNFWASWCPPCKAEMPDFNEKFKELGTEVQFLMVNVTDNQRETLSSAAAFIAQAGYKFPVYYDIAQEAATTYQAYSIPRTFFIDAEGYIVANALGSISGAVLQQGIDMIFLKSD